MLAGCGSRNAADTDERAPAATPASVPDLPPGGLPTVAVTLTRRDLILAVAEAASESASGRDDAARQRLLDGQTFSFRIRMCEGAPSRGRMIFDPEERVLRISVTPDLDQNDPVARALGSDQFEAVEGFWVPYPWLLQAACPAAAATGLPEASASGEPEPAPTARPTVALAQFFGEGTARSIRRAGRPYSVTQRVEDGAQPEAVDLVLGGRLAALPGGKVINCMIDEPSLRPQCVISVRFDAVQLARASDGAVLAEWSGT